MTRRNVHLEIDGHRIIASMPEANCQVVFFRSEDRSSLKEAPGMAIDASVPRAARESFEASAWEAATRKARELGWID